MPATLSTTAAGSGPVPSIAATGPEVRRDAREGRLQAHTSGLAAGHVQGNLVILPKDLADELDAHRAAALPVDGRDPVPHEARRRHVPRPRAVARPHSRAAAAHQRDRQRDLRGGVGVERRDLRDDRKITLPELDKRGYPEAMAVGTLAGAATLGLLIPPSIIMIVYGVAANVSIAKLFIAGVLPGIALALVFMGYIVVWSLRHRDQLPADADEHHTLAQKLAASRHLIPVVTLIAPVLGSIYTGIATATEAAALGVAGSLALAAIEGSLTRRHFVEGLASATRVYCMIGLILAGAAFLQLTMGFIGLPRHLAEFIGGLGLAPFALMLLLIVFFVVLGCFLDGISMVVLTIAVLLPTVQKAGFDPIWFGIFVVLVVEMAQITPPVGFNLFVLQGLTKRDITWIAKVSMPLFWLMLAFVILMWFVPGLATWLPSHM